MSCVLCVTQVRVVMLAHTCAHTVTYWQSICGTCRCAIHYVKGEWCLTAPSKYRVRLLIWQLKVSGQLQVQDVPRNFLVLLMNRAYYVTTLLITEQTLLQQMLYVLIMFRMLNYSSLFLYIHNFSKKEKYCYAFIFQNSVLFCTYTG